MRKYLTPLDIPAAKRGEAEIIRTVEPPGTEMMLGNLRTAMYGQGTHKPVSYPFPTTWHQLLLGGSRMMSDWPIEQRQHNEELRGFRGSVLVGGLGLGYAATVLLRRPSVTRVTVVEISADVIELVAPFTKDPQHKLTVVHADLLEYLRDHQGPRFDRAFFDIWASDGEGTFHDTVVPLYRLTQGKVRKQPVNWNEDVMRGQLCSALSNRLMLLSPEAVHIRPKQWDSMTPLWEDDGTDRPWHNWCVPFFRWWKDRQPNDEAAQLAAQLYAGIYGCWDWEKEWQKVARL